MRHISYGESGNGKQGEFGTKMHCIETYGECKNMIAKVLNQCTRKVIHLVVIGSNSTF